MLVAVVGHEKVRTVEQFLVAFNHRRLDRLIRLTTADQSIRLPDGTVARGRLATGRLIAWILWRSRGTLRITPLTVQAHEQREVWVRSRNTARRGDVTLDLEMALIFSMDHDRISAIRESVHDLESWTSFWR
jgi:limonene-1,2-epoxide hydrolase